MMDDDTNTQVHRRHYNIETKKGHVLNEGHSDSHRSLQKEHTSFRDDEGDDIRTLADHGQLDNAHPDTSPNETKVDNVWQSLASVIGNVLEWYDFAVFGSLSDVLGQVFFPPSSKDDENDNNLVQSFAVFGGAFLMRPIGGMLFGFVGDRFGRKRALTISIFLMAFPTFAMGCLPGYQAVGPIAILLLIIVRLLQGLSVGGQLMSSLVYTLESHDPIRWGLYGSYVLCAANVGTLLGNLMGTFLRSVFNEEQLLSYGWRIPFLSGIIVSFSGFYLRSHGDEIYAQSTQLQAPLSEEEDAALQDNHHHIESDAGRSTRASATYTNPIRLAFSKHNLRSLLAASTVPMLWSAGFYLSFVWMAMYTEKILENPLPYGFVVNCMSLLVSVCIFFPYAGLLSDFYGRRRIMTIGGVSMGALSPLLIWIIGRGNPFVAFVAQSIMGVALSCWGAPMMAWLVEGFEPEARLTSVAIGYNIAQAFAGGMSPAVATLVADAFGPNAPGMIFPVVAIISLVGLWVIAPPTIHYSRIAEQETTMGSETELIKAGPVHELL